ncbi:hypothetical protein Tco_0961673 [Tanacetum coccineum]
MIVLSMSRMLNKDYLEILRAHVKRLKTEQKQELSGLIWSSLIITQSQDEVVKSRRACHQKEHEKTSPTVPSDFSGPALLLVEVYTGDGRGSCDHDPSLYDHGWWLLQQNDYGITFIQLVHWHGRNYIQPTKDIKKEVITTVCKKKVTANYVNMGYFLLGFLIDDEPSETKQRRVLTEIIVFMMFACICFVPITYGREAGILMGLPQSDCCCSQDIGCDDLYNMAECEYCLHQQPP